MYIIININFKIDQGKEIYIAVKKKLVRYESRVGTLYAHKLLVRYESRVGTLYVGSVWYVISQVWYVMRSWYVISQALVRYKRGWYVMRSWYVMSCNTVICRVIFVRYKLSLVHDIKCSSFK